MKIAIYQTSDLHGYVYPTDYVKEKPLGLLKIGSYIVEDKKQYNASLTLDCGDLIQGSAFANYVQKQNIQPNPIAQGMKAIGYDAFVLGNHEFNYGLSYLTSVYQDLQEKIINANIEGLPFVSKPYRIFDMQGYKIGVIGLTTSYIPNWEQPQNITGLTFHNPVEMYGAYEQELKEQADFIIVCYHGGFECSVDETMQPTEALTKENQASELLQTYSSIDVILSGHQHRRICTKVKDVICIQPMHNGQSFSKLVIDTDTKEVSYEMIDTNTLTGPILPHLEQVFHDAQEKVELWLQETIGRFSKDILLDDLFQARLQGHPLVEFVHELQLSVTKADISVTNLFDSAIGFHKDVSIRDVLMNYPYPNTLRVLKVSGHNIKKAIEKSATYFLVNEQEVIINPDFLEPKVQNYNYDMFGGITYTIDVRKPFGERVVALKYKGEDMDLERMYEVVMSNYRASNTSVYPSYEGAELVKEIDVDISELMMNYLESQEVITPAMQSSFQVIWK